MVENGYTEYNTAAALQRRQMIDIYIFSFCFAPPLITSIMPPFMIYAHTQKFANWQIFISCVHPNLTVCCWGSWSPICQIMYGYNIHPSKLHIDFWIVHSLFLTEYLMLVRKFQKNFEHGIHTHSYNVILTVCFSSVNKTVNK